MTDTTKQQMRALLDARRNRQTTGRPTPTVPAVDLKRWRGPKRGGTIRGRRTGI